MGPSKFQSWYHRGPPYATCYRMCVWLCWSALTWFWLILKPLFFWPNICSKAMACDLAFWLKTLSESSEVIELDLKLGKSPDGNFWHKYPKVIWDNGEQIKTGLSNFEKNKKNICSCAFNFVSWVHGNVKRAPSRPKIAIFKNWLDTRPKMEVHETNVYPTILGGVLRGFWTPFSDFFLTNRCL